MDNSPAASGRRLQDAAAAGVLELDELDEEEDFSPEEDVVDAPPSLLPDEPSELPLELLDSLFDSAFATVLPEPARLSVR